MRLSVTRTAKICPIEIAANISACVIGTLRLWTVSGRREELKLGRLRRSFSSEIPPVHTTSLYGCPHKLLSITIGLHRRAESSPKELFVVVSWPPICLHHYQ